MESQNGDREILSQTYELIKEYLAELFDEPVHDETDGHIYVRYGSTVLQICVEPYGPEEVAVEVKAFCAQDVNPDEELLVGLLDLNHQLAFGAFSLVDRDVFFSYSLFGHNLDRRNLLGAIAAVATISDDYDDRIVARFGGQTALARIQDAGGKSQRRRAKL